jgi:hypothetical protein
MIASGEKTEEYREIKEHWISMLVKDIITGKSGLKHFWLNKDGRSRAKCINYIVNEINYCEFIKPDAIKFTNGYSKTAPTIFLEFKGIEIGEPKPEWSDNWQGEVFIIKLGKIIKK